MADLIGGKRRYDFGGEVIDAPGGGQLVIAKKSKNEVELYNDQQKSLLSVVCVSVFSSIVFFIFVLCSCADRFFYHYLRPSLACTQCQSSVGAYAGKT